jgi:TolA-binding protein
METDLHKLIVRIIEQTDDESEKQYHHLTPEQYLYIMEITSNNGNAFRKMKKYRDKPLWIDGDLNMSGLNVDDLGPIAGISGKLDISNTNVSSIQGIKVTGYVFDYNSPRERIREKQELNDKIVEQEWLREDDEWNLENGDELGEKAHALFQWLESNGNIEPLSEDDKEKLTILRQKLEDLYSEYEELGDDDGRAYEVQEAIDETQTEIEELEENDVDVYMMYPNSRYSHYGLQQFEVLIPGFKDKEYTVGTEEEMDEAALENAKGRVDEFGVGGFSPGFVDDYIDEDAIIAMAQEDYEYQVRDYPENYFNDDDFELTEEQEQRIEQLESEIEQLESEIEEYEERLRDVDDSDSPEYTEIQEYIDTLEERKDSCQEELDSIEVDREPTEDMIEDKVDEYVRDVRRDPLGYLNDLGLSVDNYVDLEALAQGIVDKNGYSILNNNDGSYDTEEINGTRYYIMSIN